MNQSQDSPQNSSVFDFGDAAYSRISSPGSHAKQRLHFWASVLSGLLVGLAAGVLVGWLVSKGDPTGLVVGSVAGTLIGGLILRRIAAFQSVLAGTAMGAFLPFGLILIDGIRSGRLFDAKPEEFTDPKALLVMGVLLAAGATLGTLLVALKKGIVRVLAR